MRLRLVFSIAVAALSAIGCSSITQSDHQSLALTAVYMDKPVDAECRLSNDKGSWEAKTPSNVSVRKSGEDLDVICKKDGMPTGLLKAVSRAAGSMWGNLIFGGGVGALIDHNKGTGYDYPNQLPVRMGESIVVDKKMERDQIQSAVTTQGAVYSSRSLAGNLTEKSKDKLTEAKSAVSAAPIIDEWDYVGIDRYGTKRPFTARVRAFGTTGKAFEEYLVGGKVFQEAAIDGQAALIGVPTETGAIFTSNWNGNGLGNLQIHNWLGCIPGGECSARGQVIGQERVVVPAGAFNTKKILLNIVRKQQTNVMNLGDASGTIIVWYAEDIQRAVKQTSKALSALPSRGEIVDMSFEETIELTARRQPSSGKLSQSSY